ncbi:thioesterase domain-containing protein [Streptomyces sp. DG2A-72]|uniref:thioesterase II family protein n=1 Tax=Streptomyces sp. DG2A-72 TaxID=3051386 RepID=UPI00265BE3A5|nr:alpha/beta fold hydrolase [Streptomyces sp. DG2A-72]MDO0931738.1 thioesterase domain-containing protein [Streptomyces sp. DG2A-72]
MTEYLSRPPRPGAAGRLLCFPYAGGGASAYVRWERGLARRGAAVDVLPVRLPGREGRIAEPRHSELAPLIVELDAELSPVLDADGPPVLLYGHSMGALLAYEVVRRRQSRGARLPSAALLAAYRAPHLPPPRIGGPDASDEELTRELAALGGLPPVLLGHPEWLLALLPIVRDDLRLCADAEGTADRVDVPLHLFAGETDELVPRGEVREWRMCAARGWELWTVPGGHFFLRTHEPALLDVVAAVVRRYLTPPHPAPAEPPHPVRRPEPDPAASAPEGP